LPHPPILLKSHRNHHTPRAIKNETSEAKQKKEPTAAKKKRRPKAPGWMELGREPLPVWLQISTVNHFADIRIEAEKKKAKQ